MCIRDRMCAALIAAKPVDTDNTESGGQSDNPETSGFITVNVDDLPKQPNQLPPDFFSLRIPVNNNNGGKVDFMRSFDFI